MTKSVTVEVPGKLMIVGEYAVLCGGEALAASVDRILVVHLEADGTGPVVVDSDFYDQPLFLASCLEIDQLPVSERLLAQIIARVSQFYAIPFANLKITVRANWAVSDGLGSSSALFYALWSAFYEWSRIQHIGVTEPRSSLQLAQLAFEDQRKYQGVGSGYDILTQSLGGFVKMRLDDTNWPGSFSNLETLNFSEYLKVYVGGEGTSTPGQTKSVMAEISENDLMPELKSEQAKLIYLLAESLNPSYREVCAQFARCRQVLSSTDYLHPCFSKLLDLEHLDCSWSFKPTGAGGVDAVLVFCNPQGEELAERALAKVGYIRSQFKLGVQKPKVMVSS